MDKKRSILNISVSIIFKILITIISVVVKRFLIQHCGNDVNGLNSLYLSIIGFLSVTELGIGSAIIYSMYKPIVEGDNDKVSALYHLFNKIYLTIGAIILIVGLAFTPFITFFAKDYDRIDTNLYATFVLMLVSSVITYGYGAKSSLIIAHKNNYISTTITSCGMLLQYALQITVLLCTSSFERYLVCRIISAIIQGVATDLISRKKYHHIFNNKTAKLDSISKSELFKSIKAMFMHRVGTLFVNTADSVIISIYIGVVSLGEYSNYTAILHSITGIISLVFSSITSVLGHMFVKTDKETSIKYCEFLHLLNFILGAVVYLGYYSIIDSLITILFSGDLVIAKSISFVITINGFVQFMRNTVLTFRDATGTFYNDRWKPLVEGAVNTMLSIIFIKLIGIQGVILATIITNLVICHIIEPYVLYKNAFEKSPTKYFVLNYGMILCFFVSLLTLDYFMVSSDRVFLHFLINGLISISISLPICTLLILAQWKTYAPIIKNLIKR